MNSDLMNSLNNKFTDFCHDNRFRCFFDIPFPKSSQTVHQKGLKLQILIPFLQIRYEDLNQAFIRPQYSFLSALLSSSWSVIGKNHHEQLLKIVKIHFLSYSRLNLINFRQQNLRQRVYSRTLDLTS